MKNVGALGYRERTVEMFYITPCFMMTYLVTNEPKNGDWLKIDESKNELGLREL
jgi:hypothetical protein